MMHELEYAGMQGALGSIDANTGDLLPWLGYGPVSHERLSDDAGDARTTEIWAIAGGVNFDAKVRRESFEPIDLFMLTSAEWTRSPRAKIAAAIRARGSSSGSCGSDTALSTAGLAPKSSRSGEF